MPKKFKKVRNDYYLDKECKEVMNNRIDELVYPSSISRTFRSLNDITKAKEFENFLFFTSFFAFYKVLPNPYFSHFMLLSSAVHKLYSIRTSMENVEKARHQIDLFLESFERLKLSDVFFKYNCHILAHLYEDRQKFGPLSRYNAYGYEGELQFDKNSCKSKNKSVEAVAGRTALRTMFQMYSDDQKEIIVDKDRIHVDEKAVPLHKIMKLLNESDPNKFKFYQKARVYNKTIKIRGLKKAADSFVKIEDQFFQVALIFTYNGENMVLCEKIPIRKAQQFEFMDYEFEVDQLNIIDLDRWKEKELFVFKLIQIRSHCMHVKMHGIFPDQYIVDLEI
jgi:hypothetical protein